MISTIEIHYDYDETEGILPSGMPKSPAYCRAVNGSCPHLKSEDGFCTLFLRSLVECEIGKPSRKSFQPAFECRRHEMQGR